MSPHISFAEATIVLIVTILIDLTDLFLTVVELGLIAIGVGVFGTVAKAALNFFVTGIIQAYLFLRGIRNLAFLAGSILEFIPLVNVLPMRTVSMAILIFLVNKKHALEQAATEEKPAE
ncbi:MAG: hypothetical protein HYS43_01955 [Candidatus Liptonbacteria bacterium]|nr:hypothetical protein [Candidatus Liptonbacteria bacterium]